MKSIAVLFMFVSLPCAAAEIGDALQALEEIHSMRESLTSGVQGKVDAKTFKAVCGPVGEKVKGIGKNKGWQIRQVSVKNRNPQNFPSRNDMKAIKKFEANEKLLFFAEKGGAGYHYYRRIDVRQACLKCHGAKSDRPAFIVKKYPGDKAFGFKEGELRGIYSVFVPAKGL